jgi:hypothetical protein
LADALDADDVRTLDALLDPGHDSFVGNRSDVRVSGSRLVVLAQR